MPQTLESRAAAQHGRWGRFWSGCRCEVCWTACPHGVIAGYNGWRCRCDECRQANTLHARSTRKSQIGRTYLARIVDHGCCKRCGARTRRPKAPGPAPKFCPACAPDAKRLARKDAPNKYVERVKDWGCCSGCGGRTRERAYRGNGFATGPPPSACRDCIPRWEVMARSEVSWGPSADRKVVCESDEQSIVDQLEPDWMAWVKRCPIVPSDFRSGNYLLIVEYGVSRFVQRKGLGVIREAVPWRDEPGPIPSTTLNTRLGAMHGHGQQKQAQKLAQANHGRRARKSKSAA